MASNRETFATLGLNLHPDSAECTLDDLAVNLSTPRQPEMTLEKRLQANHMLPACVPVYSIIAAEAGLYYLIGTRDILKCYYCNIEIGDWKEEDDPWEEHARYYPFCPHLKVNRVSQVPQDIASDEPESTVLDEEALENWNRLGTCMPQQESPPAGTDDGKGLDPNIHCQGSFTPGITKDHYDIFDAIQNMKTANLCRICHVRASSLVFLPCGHIVTCGQCGLILDRCPLTTCNRQIKGNFGVIRS